MRAKATRFSATRAVLLGLGYLVANVAIRALFREPILGKHKEILFASAFFGIVMSLAQPYAERLDAGLKRLFRRRIS